MKKWPHQVNTFDWKCKQFCLVEFEFLRQSQVIEDDKKFSC